MNKREVNTMFKKVVKVIKEGNFNTLEQIEDIINDTFKFEYCDGDQGYTSYLIGKYEGKITKKDIGDDTFKGINDAKAYIDIIVYDDDILISSTVFVEYYNKWNQQESKNIEIYNEKINK